MNFPVEIFQEFSVLSIPMKARFRGIDYREVAIFRGSEGWSEFSPFLEYGSEEASIWLKAALEAAYRPWPELFRTRIKVNATLPQVTVERVPEILQGFAGCTSVKIKVDDFEIGSELVEATMDYLPDAKIRLDVNGGWSLDEALLHLYDYNLRFGNIFEYIEQPCHTLEELKKLKAEIPFKIAADEAIRKELDSPLELLHNYADIAILKWAPVGGIQSAHELAGRIGLPVVISSALETGIGIAQGLALAASFPELEYACGLGTVSLLDSDICEPFFIANDGYLDLRRAEPVSALVAKYSAAPERVEWWQRRIIEIWESESFREGRDWE